jgi:ATP-dependent Clp protease adaptor protein ClpS
MPKRRPQEEGDTQTATEERVRTEKPRLFRVILHNDDFTTMEFVIRVLTEVFNKAELEATELMFQVHTRGACLAGVYTFEIAETKVHRVQAMADAAEFPFLCTMEPE